MHISLYERYVEVEDALLSRFIKTQCALRVNYRN